MRRINWLMLLGLCLALTFAGSAFATDWTIVHQDAENDYDLFNVSIVDENNLFFTTDNVRTDVTPLGSYDWVMYSGDGGTTLESRYYWDFNPFGELFMSGISIRDIDMTSPTQGHMCGLNATGIIVMGPKVWGTLDGAMTVEPRDTFPTGLFESAYYLNVIGFSTPTKGFAFGNTMRSYTSDDAGGSWTKLENMPSKYYPNTDLGGANELRDVAFDGEGGIYVTAAYVYSAATYDDDDYVDGKDTKADNLEESEDGELFLSNDNGLTWSRIYTYEAAGYDQGGFPSVEFKDAAHGWMTFIGTSGGLTTDILYTFDGAVSWNKATLPTDADGVGAPGEYLIFDLAMNNLERGWAVGYNIFTKESVVLVTNDGGITWEFDDYSGLGELRKIEMLNHRRGWAVGGHMTVISFNNTENDAPVADAGEDDNVNPGATVALDGTGSYDPDGDAITYFWELTEGPNAVLDNTSSATPTFTAVNEDACYIFKLVVTDALSAVSEPDYVAIAVGDADCESPDDDDDDSDDDDDTDDDDDDEEDDTEDDSGCCG